jgi:DNA (cytosine-5)-methyltransferase 1
MYFKNNHEFYVVDLFAGCGGLSEGFTQSGFTVAAEIEMDKWACETLKTRHLFYELRKARKLSLYSSYIRGEISRDDILDLQPKIKETLLRRVIQATLGEDDMETVLQKIESSLTYHGASRVNVLLGGPPCQPYSSIGRSRDPDRMENDHRHYLYRHYLTIMKRLKPDFFVYENVPGIFSAKIEGERIFSKLQEDFYSLDPQYEITPPLHMVRESPGSYVLNSADFGVPQRRKRLILIGYRKDLEQHNPRIGKVFGRLQQIALENRRSGYITVRDAISDLPSIKAGEGNDQYYGYYETENELTPYQNFMRRYSPGVLNHRARTHMESDIERYKFFIEHHRNGSQAANLTDLIEQRPDLKPDHKNTKDFKDRFRVQWWDSPSSTIMAHISKDGHYYVHPDIKQCRSFTVREAARCQSFPDNYKFEGPRTEQFKQVGNAVPPRLAYHVAKVILDELKQANENQNPK